MSKIVAGILTFNRSEPLCRALDSVISQGIEDLEIIVVDNNSTDNTETIVRQKYPQVKYIKNAENLGGPGGRNVIYRNCTADYIINIDDDGYLAPDTIRQIKQAFDDDSSVGVVTFRQCFTDEPDKRRMFEDYGNEAVHFYEGVCAFRMKMLEEVGLYPEDFFQYHEALDLGIRILDSQWRMISRPDIVMWHPRTGGGGANEDGRWDYYKFKNYLYVVTRYFPAPLNWIYFFRKAGLYFFYAIKHRSLGKYFRAMAKVISDLPKAKSFKKVRPETVRRYYG